MTMPETEPAWVRDGRSGETNRWPEPDDGTATSPEQEPVSNADEIFARALLEAAIGAEEGRPSTRAELIAAAQVHATLELAAATREKAYQGAHAYRVDRETGAFTDLGPIQS